MSIKGSVTITLDGSNKSTKLPLLSGSLGPDAFDIHKLHGDLGVFTYDPGYGATASCSSQITYIDGEEGVLLYRGYPIEQLAEHSTFLEVCYLLEFIPIKSSAAKGSDEPESYATHSRFP